MADLTTEQRDKLPAEHFAVPGKRALPMHDANHVRLAWSMVEKTGGLSSEEKATARSRILHRAKVLGIDTHDWHPVHAMIDIQAMSLDMPTLPGHPNRMPFSGVLTKVDEPSDTAPSGSGGKRVVITAAAAERALPSLLGMGVNLTAAMDGHQPTMKIGVITAAEIVGNELRVTGYVWAADHPDHALRIHLDQAKLGFSFEARNLTVEASDADPLVITDLVFTGAAILLASKAAYRTTRLAALAAMQQESIEDMNADEMRVALQDVIAGAIAPISAQITALAASHTALETRVAKVGETIEAQQALIAKVDPVVVGLEKQAAAMEAAGIGTDPVDGQVAVLRRMTAAMRADAAAGRIPQNYQLPVRSPVEVKQIDLPKFEDSDGYKSMQASIAAMTTQLAAAADKLSATETKLADIKAAADLAKPAPDRKTLPPIIANLVAKAGLEIPDDGSVMSRGALNKVLASAALTEDQRWTLKTGLAKAGIVQLNTTAQ